METIGLREYLGIALDMEKNIFLRQKLIDALIAQRDRLGIAKAYTEPIKPKEQVITLEENLIQEWGRDEESERNWVLKLKRAIGIVIALLCTLLCIGFILTYVDTIEDLLGVIMLLMPFVLWIYSKRRKAQKERAEKEELEQRKRAHLAEQAWRNKQQAVATYIGAMNQYNQALATYHRDIASDKVRVLTENRQKALLCQEIDDLYRYQAEARNRLSQIYGKNIIFPKYRNLIALSSLYEYVCAGRCDTLGGHEGGYNIYETEVRLDRIITQLDRVIVQLDAIRNNQFVLFTAIKETNQQCAQILDAVQEMNRQGVQILEATQGMSDMLSRQVDSINEQTELFSSQLQELNKNSVLTAYHSERTQKELDYMNRMNYLSGKNDEVFFNLPPI